MPDGRPALLGGVQLEAVFTTIFLSYFFGYVGLARNGGGAARRDDKLVLYRGFLGCSRSPIISMQAFVETPPEERLTYSLATQG